MAQDKQTGIVERLDKYIGLAAAIASAIAIGNPAYFFAFLGVAVVLLAVFLLRVLMAKTVVQAGEPRDDGISEHKRAFTPRQRLAAAAGLVALVLATGAIVALKWPKPPPAVIDLEIADLDIIDSDSRAQWDAAVVSILADYAVRTNQAEGDVRSAYERGDPEIVELVSDALENDPPEIELVRLQLTLRSERTESATLVTDVIVWVHSATLLFSCKEEGYLGVKSPYDISLCPEISADELPMRYDVPGVSFELAAGTGQEVLDVLVSNDPSCTRSPGIALYELELELIYDNDRSLISGRFVIAVPTSSYGIGVATIKLEEGTDFEPEDECQAFNLNRALAMDALWEDILHSSRANGLREHVQRIEAERKAATGS